MGFFTAGLGSICEAYYCLGGSWCVIDPVALAVDKSACTFPVAQALPMPQKSLHNPAGELGRRQHGNACNVDAFLLGPGTTLESHLAQYCSGEGLLLVSLEPSPQSLPRTGVVLLVWQPQVPQDIVQACSALPPCLTDGTSIRGLLLVDASPSLTLSVTHKALESAGLHILSRKPTVVATRTAQAPQAAMQALQQLSDALPPPLAPTGWSLTPGSVRIAVARDDAFAPCFHENLTLLNQSGAQLLFFSPLYDAALPAGATCLYLSSGPLEPERWQQLAANRALLGAVRAFCDAGGMVLAEGAGLLYLSRTIDLNEDEGSSKTCVHDMAGVLPFKARLLADAQTASVQVLVTAGNPLLPEGSRPRGYLSAQASIVIVEERQLHNLFLGATGELSAGKAVGPQLNTTYEVTVIPEEPQSRTADGSLVSAAGPGANGSRKDGKEGGTALPPPSLEGYTLHNNVLASSCLLFLPSEPGLALHWLQRCTCLDPAALAAGMAQHVSGSMAAASAAGIAATAKKVHLQSALGSAACSRAGSRRQSIHDVSALPAAYASNGGISAGSSCGMLAGLEGWGAHLHQHHAHHLNSISQQQHQYHHLQGTQCHQPQAAKPLSAAGCLGYGQGSAACGGNGCEGLCPSPLTRLSSNTSSATGASHLGLVAPARRSLCGVDGRLPLVAPPHESVPGCARGLDLQSASPHTTPFPQKQQSRASPVPWARQDSIVEGPRVAQEDGLAAQQEQAEHHHHNNQRTSSGMQLTASANVAPRDATQHNLNVPDKRGTASAVNAPISEPGSPQCPREATCAATGCGGDLKCTWAMERGDGIERARGSSTALGPTDLPVVLQPGVHHSVSGGSFPGCGPVGSSTCSLSDLAHQQRPHNRCRVEDLAVTGPTCGPGYVGWATGMGPTAGVGAAGPGLVPAGVRHGSVMMLGHLGTAAAVGHNGVVCCAPGACEALVAMGLASRLIGIGSNCDHPPDVCTSRRVVLGWVPQDEAPQGAAARGIRVVMPGGATMGPVVSGASLSLGLGGGGGGASRSGRTSVDRCGAVRCGRALLVDELALRQEPPSVLVLPDPAELSEGELEQLEQALVETGLVNPSGSSSSTCRVLHTSCRTLVDVMDLIMELGAALDEPQAASLLLERLQTRIRRVVAAAAAAGSPARLPPSSVTPVVGASPAAPLTPRWPRVLVLQSLQPLVEPGRWVPEMLAMAGATSCMTQAGGPDVALSWQDIRERAAPDVLVILTSPGEGVAGDARGGGGGSSGGPSSALHDQLAALAAQPGWWCLPAVRVSQVYLMQPSYCVRPGPRLVDGLELLARLLIPGQYSSSRKVPAGAVMRLSLAAGQRCRATLLPSYFVPITFN
ncbi:hypothetical protein VOLCADRAFT_107975 [Volvox carteri f. nagariensis]|uniref:CobB/CobQ-like glutamine amidotransferase domain-containing protein n=1 Tax=Volvox carteri f. nagariensis TaxID=3068 RepID=D8UHJ1_VOLCA|nr:uncharacterized protein VOLCADRAFT_107975 [Volvox carteri f. nagariensis]EFJ40834.1 hypothetical protein VOLCADRAFT_107975 [Volvox carteri f. nagariensis]|eukprot:XP_002958103.1 hypothetical protein VOLCADRAFT_107975 [Volvox carteri f. nagariensis]